MILYIFLLGIRLWCSTSDTGFVHPDEWSQNGEIVAGNGHELYYCLAAKDLPHFIVKKRRLV